jgi:hypothetical protein
VLTSGPKIRRLNSGRGRWIFWVIKILSTNPLRRGESPVIDLRHVKESYEREKRCFVGKFQRPCFFAHVSPASLLDGSAGKSYEGALADEPGFI